MHLDKYKHAWYWFINLRNRRWHFQKFEKNKNIGNMICNGNIQCPGEQTTCPNFTKINKNVNIVEFSLQVGWICLNPGFETDDANTGPFWWICRFKLWMTLFILSGMVLAVSAATTVSYTNHRPVLCIVDSSNTDLNPLPIQALLISVFDESTTGGLGVCYRHCPLWYKLSSAQCIVSNPEFIISMLNPFCFAGHTLLCSLNAEIVLLWSSLLSSVDSSAFCCHSKFQY